MEGRYNATIEVKRAPEKPDKKNPGCGLGSLVLFGLFAVLLTSVLSNSPTSNVITITSDEEATKVPFSTISAKSDDAQFRVGDEVVVVLPGWVHVRRTPGYRNKPAGDDVCQGAKTGERFRIIDGSQYVDEIWWWKVSNERCPEGWMAQTRGNGDVILQRP